MDCSADGKFFIFQDQTSLQYFRMSPEGGKPELIPNLRFPQGIIVANLAISPEGKTVATHATITPATGAPMQRIAFFDLTNPNSKPVLIAPDPRISGGLRYSPDGKSLIYPVRVNGTDNEYLQPIAGSTESQPAPGKFLTHFADDSAGACVFSPDNQHIGCVRNHPTSNAILLHDSTPAK